MSGEENKALTRRIIEEFINKNSPAVADELIADDFINHTPPSGISPDREGLKQMVAFLHQRYPDVQMTLEDVVVENDKVVEIGRMKGTHTGWSMGIPPTNRKIDVNYIFISRIQEGKLKDRWGIINEMEVMRQLASSEEKGYHGLRSITYTVSDIEKAKNWYSQVFNITPTYESAFIVIFLIGDSGFVLIPSISSTLKSMDGNFAYWEVDDIRSEYSRLQKLGAKVHEEISSSFNRKRASFRDPFGNIFGITSPISDINKNALQEDPSQTAMGVTVWRALAAVDEREEIRGNDFMAEIFLSDNVKATLKNTIRARKMLTTQTPGMYEYIISRTAYFDNIYEKALRDNISQVVFLGAGYDTRPYRFKHLIKDTKIFELDIQTTQQNKLKLLQQNNIPKPDQLTYVSINFNTDTFEDVLLRAGYRKGQKNLFIWEGVTYHILHQAVDNTLHFIKSTSASHSSVCFDYSTYWPEMWNTYGVKELLETMRTLHPGEGSKFSIERGKIESFLSERGYKLIDHLTAEEIEKKYLMLKDGSSAGKIVGIFCFAQASIS